MSYLLEDELECWPLNARHMRNVPGRKTDTQDAAWIAQLVEYGLVRPSFVPQPVRELRNLTRYRKAQIEERTREVQRAGQDSPRRRGETIERCLQRAGCLRSCDAAGAGFRHSGVVSTR